MAIYKITAPGDYRAWAAPRDPHSPIAITATEPGPAGKTSTVADDIRQPRIAGVPESHPGFTSGDLIAVAAGTELRTDPATADLKVYAMTLIHDTTA